jgi:hypothetical protein
MHITKTHNEFLYDPEDGTWLSLDYNHDGTVSLGVARHGVMSDESAIVLPTTVAALLGCWLVEKTAPTFLRE